MHKLGKGLKKKIKGKKGKEKEEDLFDQVSLEREVKLRREKEAAAVAAAAAAAEANGQDCEGEEPNDDCETGAEAAAVTNATGGQESSSSTTEKKVESEEWARFKLLTSGKLEFHFLFNELTFAQRQLLLLLNRAGFITILLIIMIINFVYYFNWQVLTRYYKRPRRIWAE